MIEKVKQKNYTHQIIAKLPAGAYLFIMSKTTEQSIKTILQKIKLRTQSESPEEELQFWIDKQEKWKVKITTAVELRNLLIQKVLSMDTEYNNKEIRSNNLTALDKMTNDIDGVVTQLTQKYKDDFVDGSLFYKNFKTFLNLSEEEEQVLPSLDSKTFVESRLKELKPIMSAQFTSSQSEYESKKMELVQYIQTRTDNFNAINGTSEELELIGTLTDAANSDKDFITTIKKLIDFWNRNKLVQLANIVRPCPMFAPWRDDDYGLDNYKIDKRGNDPQFAYCQNIAWDNWDKSVNEKGLNEPNLHEAIRFCVKQEVFPRDNDQSYIAYIIGTKLPKIKTNPVEVDAGIHPALGNMYYRLNRPDKFLGSFNLKKSSIDDEIRYLMEQHMSYEEPKGVRRLITRPWQLITGPKTFDLQINLLTTLP